MYLLRKWPNFQSHRGIESTDDNVQHSGAHLRKWSNSKFSPAKFVLLSPIPKSYILGRLKKDRQNFLRETPPPPEGLGDLSPRKFFLVTPFDMIISYVFSYLSDLSLWVDIWIMMCDVNELMDKKNIKKSMNKKTEFEEQSTSCQSGTNIGLDGVQNS